MIGPTRRLGLPRDGLSLGRPLESRPIYRASAYQMSAAAHEPEEKRPITGKGQGIHYVNPDEARKIEDRVTTKKVTVFGWRTLAEGVATVGIFMAFIMSATKNSGIPIWDDIGSAVSLLPSFVWALMLVGGVLYMSKLYLYVWRRFIKPIYEFVHDAYGKDKPNPERLSIHSHDPNFVGELVQLMDPFAREIYGDTYHTTPHEDLLPLYDFKARYPGTPEARDEAEAKARLARIEGAVGKLMAQQSTDDPAKNKI